METTTIFIQNLIKAHISRDSLFKRNLAKTYLQILVLDFIYSRPEYSDLVFYGGSCLSHCFGLPRLSEDLDFVDLGGKINILTLAEDLEKFFRKNTNLNLTVTSQKFRIYLKFPILRELKLSGAGESDFLFVKLEIFKEFNFCKDYRTEIIPLFKFNKSILVKTFDLPTLMATKIRAILYRKWEKTGRKGKTLIRVKGRDYFDLMWYLGRGVSPNIKCIEIVKDKKELKNKLLEIISRVDSASIKLDLEPLIEDIKFVKNLSKNIKEILRRELEAKL
ncbi:MAG: hypothetical protein COU42_01710 [Candidatus Nealsonbacteria bacterium CG10_big_fil_rev_8_21_14_0_10_36_24]|uniref:Nucleotidyl transferase AbiEii/AbiGii toxin family protein n=2 Tax=Candidatus Nealsoniibacteriota TaxID=1817911 RepID=A0A2H0YPI5_9BACT|nr:MAG: hypothetical protein COU42_01710 [Candidatus Nealsonbacteria bacterium CG10_big_fil_rev_8_21_14_0_10_36_24]PIS40370.1 MAG: hypothetical protein COT32_00085 [Candidatus Nealsonbacteria bacterium CG08_land_8_20_14_0_20_36_22]